MDLCTNIITFIFGFIASLLVGLVLIYWQFTKSIAGYRLKKVEKATLEIINTKSTNSYAGPSRNRYRYSLGVIIDRLIATFGTKIIPKQKDLYPLILSSKGDGWDTFNKYVRPVFNDINSFSFIGSLPFLRKMQKLKALFRLCEQLENVTGELDAISQLAQSQNINILDFHNGSLKINLQKDSKINIQIESLLKEYNILENRWRKWLRLTDKK